MNAGTTTEATARPARWDGVTGTYPQWYEDPLSCLHTTLGSVLMEHGLEPVDVLGAACEFAFAPGDVMCEEFYRPAQSSRGVAADLCPYHDVESAWTTGSDADDLIRLIETHSGVIVAVDNYHLPFRPAFHDVHAAHLVVVPGWRRTPAGDVEFYVSDAQPPGFQGWLSAEHLVNSWTSGNPSDTQDVFFSSREIGGRVLTTKVRPQPDGSGTVPTAQAVRGNLDRWTNGTAGPSDRVWTGRAGLRRFVERLQDSCGDPEALRSAYTFGWTMQAQAFLHGRFAQERAHRTRQSPLLEVAASADRVVSAWSNVRLLSAHAARTDGITELIPRRGAELVLAYEQLAADWRLVLAGEGADPR
ncbi:MULTISPECIES: BtrH N-terminal domain-containing protein [unclassified Streptomyces]|uniref:BtrH N-terminal domain-containing protein n=1 Tax=unclassified Streptomyces TaxID=2593676 RepID=UPI002252D5C1|nr:MULTISPECIES: BtrH N-terminal domain-containing protein [unclassified Streptomyces]MCX5144104.1 BtrH N-terminal domain-containing protein [Streptomyces sp. NBC_00338]WSU62439.1 BtrH N-terminal domain-containing protein [Streptomyces sp. NBC_01104]